MSRGWVGTVPAAQRSGRKQGSEPSEGSGPACSKWLGHWVWASSELRSHGDLSGVAVLRTGLCC